MTINPFVISGVIPNEFFCDRTEESERLITSMLNQENVVLISPRRMGKTQLIYHCFADKRVSKNIRTLTIDILHTTSLREFILELGTAVFHTFARRSDKLMKLFASCMRSLSASFGYDPVQNTPTFDIRLGEIQEPEYTLREIFDFLDKMDKRCVIAIDEFQQIVNYPDKNIEALLRGYVQKSKNTNFIFAGSQRTILSEMFFSYARPFYQSATMLQLDAIPETEYCMFAKRMFALEGKKLKEEAVGEVYKFFNGVTLYVQKVFHDAFAIIDKGGICDETMARQTMDRFLEESTPRLREQLQFVSEQQKELLYAICDEGKATKVTSTDFIRRHHLRSASSVQSALRRLTDLDLITNNARVYSLSDPLLAQWIKRKIL